MPKWGWSHLPVQQQIHWLKNWKRRLSKKDRDRVLVNTFHGFIRMQLDIGQLEGQDVD